MVRRIVAVIAVSSVLLGCAHVHRIDPIASVSDRGHLNTAVQHRRVSVELVGSYPWRPDEKLNAENVRVAADSTSLTLLLEPSEMSALWGEPSHGAKRDTILSTLAITRMTTKSRLRGVLDGSLLGLVIGAVGGAILFAAIDDPVPVEDRAVIGGVVFGVIGTGVGLVLGAVVGSRDVYDLAER
jgi:hypothetical protein